jgi:hypothetical protein
MLRLELATLSIRTATAAAALQSIERYAAREKAAGALCGVWTAEIGALNRILLLRSFDAPDALYEARARAIESGDFFGVGGELVDCTFETWAPYPFVKPQLAGAFGSFYEVRVYAMKPAGMRPTLDAWEVAIPPRTKLSPIVVAAYALDGVTPRMLHICPYNDLNERMRIRGEAVASGSWPPTSGPDWLTVMQSTICIPAKFSPMR